MPVLLVAAIALSALATIACDWRGQRRAGFYLFKPLTTLLVIALGGIALPPVAGYREMVLIALAACLVGDVLLMFKGHAAFAAGLLAFLAAHLVLSVAFVLDRALPIPPAAYALIALIALVFVVASRWLLRAVRGVLVLPVILYVGVLATMVATAGNKALAHASPGTTLLYAGALLFAVSDGVLAYRKFIRAPWWGQPVTLVSYYLAIGLFACAY